MKDAPTPRPNKRPRLGPSPAESVSRAKEKASRTTKNGPKVSGDLRFEEFAKAIRPRTQKGPSWANEDSVPSASTSKAPPKASKLRSKPLVGNSFEGPAGDEANAGGLSDLDWLKRHTKSSENDAIGQQEQLYEQSDEETDEKEDVAEVLV